jgi:hypothetical protein
MEMPIVSRLQANRRRMNVCSLRLDSDCGAVSSLVRQERIVALLMGICDCLASSLLSNPSSSKIEAE